MSGSQIFFIGVVYPATRLRNARKGMVQTLTRSSTTFSMGPGCGVRHRGNTEENLQGLDKRKEGPIRVFQCANRRDAKCH